MASAGVARAGGARPKRRARTARPFPPRRRPTCAPPPGKESLLKASAPVLALGNRHAGPFSLPAVRIGLFTGAMAGAHDLDALVADVRDAADEGFASVWAAQTFAFDALTALALAGREVDGIELGTAVVPTYPRHPMVLAQQALTVQAAVGGRLVLGIGLSHQIVIEDMFGYSFDRPVRHLREFLSVLLPLVRAGDV